jgi:hypothetical protein
MFLGVLEKKATFFWRCLCILSAYSQKKLKYFARNWRRSKPEILRILRIYFNDFRRFSIFPIYDERTKKTQETFSGGVSRGATSIRVLDYLFLLPRSPSSTNLVFKGTQE